MSELGSAVALILVAAGLLLVIEPELVGRIAASVINAYETTREASQ